jgi:hypothetical protein
MGLHLYVQHVSISRLTQYIEEVHIDGLGSLLLKRGGIKNRSPDWKLDGGLGTKNTRKGSKLFRSCIYP